MTSTIIRISFIALLFGCFSFGYLYAGGDSKVTEEDKNAAIEASQIEENKAKEKVKKSGETNFSASYVSPIKLETLYKQSMSKESINILPDFEAYDKDIAEHSQDYEYIVTKNNEFFKGHSGNAEEVVGVDDFTIHVDGDEKSKIKSEKEPRDIPVRLYHTASGETGKLVIYAHGGGWSAGDLDTADYFCRKMANGLEADVLSVDYRRLQANKYPLALNDFAEVYAHYAKEKNYKGIILAGDDVGANLCAALCIKLFDTKKELPEAQILVYPLLGKNFDSESYKAYGKVAALKKESVVNAFKDYSEDPERDDKLIYPINQRNMDAFPRTVVITAGYDVAVDDQLNFVIKFTKAKKSVYHILDQGAFHGYMSFGSHYNDLITKNWKKVKAYLDGENPNEAVEGEESEKENVIANTSDNEEDSNNDNEEKTDAVAENKTIEKDSSKDKEDSTSKAKDNDKEVDAENDEDDSDQEKASQQHENDESDEIADEHSENNADHEESGESEGSDNSEDSTKREKNSADSEDEESESSEDDGHDTDHEGDSEEE